VSPAISRTVADRRRWHSVHVGPLSRRCHALMAGSFASRKAPDRRASWMHRISGCAPRGVARRAVAAGQSTASRPAFFLTAMDVPGHNRTKAGRPWRRRGPAGHYQQPEDQGSQHAKTPINTRPSCADKAVEPKDRPRRPVVRCPRSLLQAMLEYRRLRRRPNRLTEDGRKMIATMHKPSRATSAAA